MINKAERMSVVDNVVVYNIGLASVLKLGDSHSLQPKANVLAVQRQVPVFWDNEGDLEQFTTFARDIPVPRLHEQMKIIRENDDSIIHVGQVKVTSISGAGILHIGSTHEVKTEARTMNIRHFIV